MRKVIITIGLIISLASNGECTRYFVAGPEIIGSNFGSEYIVMCQDINEAPSGDIGSPIDTCVIVSTQDENPGTGVEYSLDELNDLRQFGIRKVN